MNTKLIAVGLGAFSYGALLSWAITADAADQRLLAQGRLIRRLMNTNNKDFYESHVHNNSYIYGERPARTEEDLLEELEVLRRNREEAEYDAQVTESGAVLNLEPIRGDEPALVDIVGTDTEQEPPVVETIEIVDEEITFPDDGGIIPPGETPEETKAKLQKIIDRYTVQEVDVQSFIDQVRVEENNMPNQAPYVITQDEFAWDEEGEDQAKITLQWYPRERILLDDEQDPIEQKLVDGYVGWANLNRFGDGASDANVVFIRNRRLGTDYEVIREEGHPPAHVRYGMTRTEYETNKAAGVIRFREEDG